MNLQELTLKRTRVPNFTADEKTILTKLVNKRKDVIECKATDTKSIMKKKEAWLLVEKEFNRVMNVYKRDHTVLKTAWDNIKAQTRKMEATKRDNLIKTESKSPAPPSPLQKETILRMVEEVACINTSEKLVKGEEEPSLVIKKEVNSETGVQKSSPSFKEVSNDLNSDEKIIKEPEKPTEQCDAVLTSDQNDSNHLSVDMDYEPEDSSYIKCEDNSDKTIENSILHITSIGDSIYREADVFLNSLQLQNNSEHQILKAKLQTALLEQQAAEISLEAAKLDLALLAKRLQD